VIDTIIEPAIRATGFTGFLYAGLMMTSAGPKVLEFKRAVGRSETQPLMHRLDSSFADMLMRGATGSLAGAGLRWKADPSVCVVLAASGYPGQVRPGDMIHESPAAGRSCFQAGTKVTERGLETAGGRVLGVTASGPTLASAISNVYGAVEHIHFDGCITGGHRTKGLKRWP